MINRCQKRLITEYIPPMTEAEALIKRLFPKAYAEKVKQEGYDQSNYVIWSHGKTHKHKRKLGEGRTPFNAWEKAFKAIKEQLQKQLAPKWS